MTVLNRWHKDTVEPSKVACFGSDGDSTFAGCRTGVVARLLVFCFLMVAFHCVLHQIPLGSRDATKVVPYLQTHFFNILEHLGRYYDDSPKRLAILEKLQRQELGNVIKIIRSAFTRWLTHDGVSDRVHRSLVPVLLELKQSSSTDATALGLFSMTTRLEFVAFLLIARDVLPIVAHLSGSWQSNNTDFAVVAQTLQASCVSLEKQISKPGRQSRSQDNTVAALSAKGFDIKSTPGRTAKWLEDSRRKWIRALIDNLRARLPNPRLLIAFMALLNPQQYPAGRDDLPDYADDDIEILIAHYCSAKSISVTVQCPTNEFAIDAQGKVTTQQTVMQKTVQLFSASELRNECQMLKSFVYDMKDQTKSVEVLQHERGGAEDSEDHSDDEELFGGDKTKKRVRKKVTLPVDAADVVASWHQSQARIYAKVHVTGLLHIYTTLTVHTAECERRRGIGTTQLRFYASDWEIKCKNKHWCKEPFILTSTMNLGQPSKVVPIPR